ncbi:hypothetical protein O3M35_007272 [Rhynocoris fuscipes]|uniref:Uncharacterized protein n=1 Tax=Rhynocoris fuscipes TaxID=488301 RepID=A0AAW1DFZ2_9HEMI
MSSKNSFFQIKSLLQKYSPEELHSLIPELFSDIGWDAVYSLIRKNKLSCQSKYIAAFTTSLYESSKPPKDNIQFVTWALQFFDKISHNNQNWHGIHLINQVEEITRSEKIEENIIRAYRIDARDAEVVLKIDELIYIMTIEKVTSQKGVQYKKPFFFAYNHNLHEPYAFYSPKFNGCEDLVRYCCKGMGYEDYEEISLFGFDVNSLFDMIEKEISTSKSLMIAKDYEPVTVNEEEEFVDFTLGKEREKYAEELLPGQTKLQTYSVEANTYWNGLSLPDLNGIKIDSSLNFNCPRKGVEDMLKEMIKRGMVHLPAPAYIANLPYTAKNIIELNDNDNENQSNFDNSVDEWE